MLIQKLIQQGTALTECSDYNKAKEETNHILEMIDATENDEFSEGTELLILEKILSNFYMHIKAMYRMDVHGSGTIKKRI